MSLSFCSFASGSSGNCYLIKTSAAAVLIDAGISASRILKELIRTDTPHEDISALFLSHGHYDHVTGARVLMKKLKDAKVYATYGTMEETIRRDRGKRLSFSSDVSEERRIIINVDEAIHIGEMTVYAFRTVHDSAEPCGYRITAGGKTVAIVTDTGAVTDEILEFVADADVLVLEANHDTELLRRGPYPPYLKHRIMSDHGHLSNSQTAEAILRLFGYLNKKRVILLAHLSGENNTPAIAERTVLTALAREGLFTGSDLYMGVLLRDEASLLYRL